MLSKNDRRIILIISAAGSFLTTFMSSSSNLALPEIGEQFEMGAVALGWVATSYLLATAMFLVPFGRIGDLIGRKKVFTLGVLIFTLFSFLTSLVPSASMLIAARVLQGLGAALIFATAFALVTSAFPANERGKAIGINVAAAYLGLSVGPFLGGILTQYLGWRSVFWATGLFGVPILGLAFKELKEDWAEAKGEAFDLLGSFFYMVPLVLLIYGLSSLPAPRGIILAALGLAGLGFFLWYESRLVHPVLNVGLFRGNRVLLFSYISTLINFSATFAVSFLVSLYLQYLKGMTPEHAGFVLVAQPAIQVIFSPLAGRLSDRVQPRFLSSAGMALTAVGLFLLTRLEADSSLIFILATLALIGLGIAFFASPNSNTVMSSVARKSYGVASGLLGTMRLLGQMFSMGLVMVVLALHLGHAEIEPANYPAFLTCFKTSFVIFAVLCLVGVLASLARGNLVRDNGTEPS